MSDPEGVVVAGGPGKGGGGPAGGRGGGVQGTPTDIQKIATAR